MDNWEYFFIEMAYIAECHTYKIKPDLSTFDVFKMRNKLVDIFMQFLRFEWSSALAKRLLDQKNYR